MPNFRLDVSCFHLPRGWGDDLSGEQIYSSFERALIVVVASLATGWMSARYGPDYQSRILDALFFVCLSSLLLGITIFALHKNNCLEDIPTFVVGIGTMVICTSTFCLSRGLNPALGKLLMPFLWWTMAALLLAASLFVIAFMMINDKKLRAPQEAQEK